MRLELMHVVHVIDGLGLGGAERMLVDIANATVADGHRVSVCVTRNELALARELNDSIDLYVLDRRARFDPPAMARFVRWLRTTDADVLHVHMRSSASFVLLLRLLMLIQVPIVFHDHFGTIETDTSVPLWFRVGHRGFAAYVGVFERLAAWAKAAGMPASRVFTIENRLDLHRLAPDQPVDLRGELGVELDTRLCVIVATLRSPKAIEVAIEALSRGATRDRIHLAIIGAENEPAYAASLRSFVVRLGLTGKVSFLGGRSEVPSILAGVDVALLSSRSESGPLVLIEYLAAALPIVATRVGDIGKQLARLGVPGFVPPDDIDAFSAELDRVIEMTEAERRARGQLGRAIIDATWDIRHAMPRWYAVYRGVIR